MLDTLRAFGRSLGQTDLSRFVRELLLSSEWLAPTAQTLHILSIAVVILSIGVIGLRLIGVAAQSYPAHTLIKRFAPLIWCALIVMLLTGSLLILNRPARYFGNWSFLSKVVLILLGATIIAIMQRVNARNPAYFDGLSRSGSGKVLGGALLAIWVMIIFAGRWIAYA